MQEFKHYPVMAKEAVDAFRYYKKENPEGKEGKNQKGTIEKNTQFAERILFLTFPTALVFMILAAFNMVDPVLAVISLAMSTECIPSCGPANNTFLVVSGKVIFFLLLFICSTSLRRVIVSFAL